MVKERVIETEVVVGEKSPCKTADEMEDVCCHAHAELPCCTKIEYWDGPTQEDAIKALGIELDDKGRNAAGEYVEIVFGPRGKPCGLKETIFDTSQGSCCDEVEELLYDHENSADVLADNSYGFVAWEGGKAPYTVSIVGQGFGLSESRLKSLTTSALFVQLFADDACGRCVVTVTDACNQAVTGGVISTNGEWAEVYLSAAGVEGDDSPRDPYPGGIPFMTDLGDRVIGPNEILSAEQGGIRVEQKVNFYSTYGSAFAIRPTMAESISYCTGSETALRHSLDDAEHRLTGFCFTGNPTRLTCGSVVGENDNHNQWYAVLGQQSIHWYAEHHRKEQVWSYQYLINVSRTYIYEWRC